MIDQVIQAKAEVFVSRQVASNQNQVRLILFDLLGTVSNFCKNQHDELVASGIGDLQTTVKIKAFADLQQTFIDTAVAVKTPM